MRPMGAGVHDPRMVWPNGVFGQPGRCRRGKWHIDHIAVMGSFHFMGFRIILITFPIINMKSGTWFSHIEFA